MNQWSKAEKAKKADFSSSSGSGGTRSGSSGYNTQASKGFKAETASTLMRGNVGRRNGDEQSWPLAEFPTTQSSSTHYSASMMTEQEKWKKLEQLDKEMKELDQEMEEMNEETERKVDKLISMVRKLQLQREEVKLQHRKEIKELKLRIRAETLNGVLIEQKFGSLKPSCVLQFAESRFNELGVAEGEWAAFYMHPEFEYYRSIVEKALHPEANGDELQVEVVEGDADQFATIIGAILAKDPKKREPGPPFTLLIPSGYSRAEKKVMRAVCGFLPIACRCAAGENDSDASEEDHVGSSLEDDENE